MNTPGITSLLETGLARPDAAESTPKSGFGEMLRGVLETTNAEQSAAETEAKKLVQGEGDIVDTMIAIGRAEVSMRFVVTLRNRALEAYQEIMRLQV